MNILTPEFQSFTRKSVSSPPVGKNSSLHPFTFFHVSLCIKAGCLVVPWKLKNFILSKFFNNFSSSNVLHVKPASNVGKDE